MKKLKVSIVLIMAIILMIFIIRYRLKLESTKEIKQVRVVEEKRNPEVIFKFGVEADIHNDLIELKKSLEQAKKDGLALMVVAGDLTINGTEKEQKAIKAVLDESGIDYLAVPGNHDEYKNVWIFGKKYQSYLRENVKLILIDNSNWRGLGEEQKKWIETEVEGCQVIRCVAVMHMPLNNTISAHVMGEYDQKTATEAEWLRGVLVTKGVKTGYSGHLHYSSSYGFEGWDTVLVGAISRERNNQTPRWTEVEVNSDRMERRVVEVE